MPSKVNHQNEVPIHVRTEQKGAVEIYVRLHTYNISEHQRKQQTHLRPQASVFSKVKLQSQVQVNSLKKASPYNNNLATREVGISVVEGVSRTPKVLLDGYHVYYDCDFGYTYHQLGSGEIMVRLQQPCYVDSTRLLLWDCDDRAYSFYIENSTNQKGWTMIIEKREGQRAIHLMNIPRLVDGIVAPYTPPSRCILKFHNIV
uniref:F5/8 type C domain-containing protein n=1 Tax=Glossina austeni TaxID=7395 RepID=A0A1A9VTB0_GLOAU